MAAQRRGPTQLDGAHHPPLDTPEMALMRVPVGVAVAAEDVRHLQAGRQESRRSGGRHPLQRQPVERALGSPDQPARDLRVARRRRQVGMSEQDLDDADVGTALQKMRGEAVAQRVHRHALGQAGRGASRAAGRMECLDGERLRLIPAGEQPVLWPRQTPLRRKTAPVHQTLVAKPKYVQKG